MTWIKEACLRGTSLVVGKSEISNSRGMEQCRNRLDSQGLRPIMADMIGEWTILAAGLVYLGALFGVATYGDRMARNWSVRAGRPVIYALSLGVYCTSWTYFGSVGIASRTGLDFIPIYLGPILVFALGWKLLQSIAAITKRHNIASIADFLSARYGKSEALGALVAVIAVIGIVPYISIQLKAVSASLAGADQRTRLVARVLAAVDRT